MPESFKKSKNEIAPKKETGLIKRRSFLKLMLGTGIGGLAIGLEEYLRLSSPPDTNSYSTDTYFEDTLPKDLLVDEPNLDALDAESLLLKYQNIEDWDEALPRIMVDIHLITNTGRWILQNRSKTENQPKIDSLIQQLGKFFILSQTAVPVDIFFDFSSSGEQANTIRALIAQNNLKFEAFSVLTNLRRLLPEQSKTIDNLLEPFDFHMFAAYIKGNFASVYGVPLISRQDINQESVDREKRVFRPMFPDSLVHFFDWSAPNEVGGPKYYYETEVKGQKTIYASKLSDTKLSGLSADQNSASQITVESGIEYRIGPDFFGEARDQRSQDIFQQIILPNWSKIQKFSQKYEVDPLLVATMIFAEHTDVKRAEFSQDSDDQYAIQLKRKLSELDPTVQKIVKQLWPVIDENTTDTLGAIVGENTSIGLGQINILMAKKERLVEFAGRVVDEQTPNWLVTLLLQNDDVAIETVAKYIRSMMNTLILLQERGENWYLPDMHRVFGEYFNWFKRNPQEFWSQNLDYPLTKEYSPAYFDIIDLAGRWYTAPVYGTNPANMPTDPDMDELELRFPLSRSSTWGKNVAVIYAGLVGMADQLGTEGLRIKQRILDNQNQLDQKFRTE